METLSCYWKEGLEGNLGSLLPFIYSYYKRSMLVWEKVQLSAVILILLIIVLYFTFLDKTYVQRSSESFVEYHDYDSDEESESEASEEPEFEPYTRQEGFTSFRRQDNFQEGFGVSDITDFFNKIGDAFKEVEHLYNEFIDKVRDLFNNLVVSIKSFFDKLHQLGPRFQRWSNSFTEVGQGMNMFFDNFGQGMKLGFDDVFDLIRISGSCGIKFITNFCTCLIFYVTDMFFSLFKSVFYTFPLTCFKNMGLDLFYLGENLYDSLLEPLDEIAYGVVGLHFLHYPNWVLEDCYTCNVMDAVNKIDNDWKTTIPDLLTAPKHVFDEAGADFIQLFDPLN